MDGDHLIKPAFLAINPQLKISTLHVNGFALWETHAILTYFMEKYGPTNLPLYPANDVQHRANINQSIYFDMGTMYHASSEAYYPTFFSGAPPTEEALKKVEASFEFLDTFLQGERFVAGGALSVADFALFSTVALYERLAKYDIGKHTNVGAWFKRLRKTIPGEKISVEGLELLAAYA